MLPYKLMHASIIFLKRRLPVAGVFFLFLLFLPACRQQGQRDYTRHVDPFVGTAGRGNTFPGAVVPFGMIQVSPDTRVSGRQSASGYFYGDSSLYGFSHTHYSGTGRGSGGDILLLPFTGEVPRHGHRTPFSHADEEASPGYYHVRLKEGGVVAELTATKRVALHRYTFPAGSIPSLFLDLTHGIADRPDSLFLRIVDDHTVEGIRVSSSGLRIYQTLWFAAVFSRPFTTYGIRGDGEEEKSGQREVHGKDLQAWFRFASGDGPLLVKVALSKVDMQGARGNLAGLPGWDFGRVRRQARHAWNRELSKIEVTGRDSSQIRIFYTALYHACIHPSLDMDLDGRYRSTNNRIYKAKGFSVYTNFSLWDTFRGLHPLQTLLNRRRTADFIRTFLERYRHAGHMPVFELSGNEVPSMIGYHSLPVVADAWAKGIREYDTAVAVAAMKDLASLRWERRNVYRLYGFVPYDFTRQSVSRTLEYSYDDWCLAQVLKSAGDRDCDLYMRRGHFYRHLFNRERRLMLPRDSRYRWIEELDPHEISSRYYTQANAWQYTTFVPQDIPWLIRAMGGENAFIRWLDRFFTDTAGTRPGMIGQYDQGNEPSHHVAYLYDVAGAPWKTQERVRQILTTQYHEGPGGLPGNDDAGQMSAWYVLSAMGFYSVTPGLPRYLTGSPLFDKVIIHSEGGRPFTIITRDNGPASPYIRSASLNGRPFNRPYLLHREIVRGGTLLFTLDRRPNKRWGAGNHNRPPYPRYDGPPVAEIHLPGESLPPFGIVTFRDSLAVTLTTDDTTATLFYTTDSTSPCRHGILYRKPFRVAHNGLLRTCAVRDSVAGYITTVVTRKLTPLPSRSPRTLVPGLKYTYREVWLCKDIRDIDRYPVLNKGLLPAFLPQAPVRMSQKYAVTYDGWIHVPHTGIYTFFLESDDGSELRIDSLPVVSNSSPKERYGRIALQKGMHRISAKHFQIGGKPRLSIAWEGPEIKKAELPAKVLFHEKKDSQHTEKHKTAAGNN